MTVEKMSSPKKPTVESSPENIKSNSSKSPAEPTATSTDKDSPASSSTQSGASPTRKKEPRIFKIIVIGDSNVGKTCLTYRFCEGRFPSKVEATIGVDFREKTVEIGDDVLKVSG